MGRQLSAQKTELAGREERYEELRRERDDARRKTEGLERYLADMPTPSAQTKRLGEVRSRRTSGPTPDTPWMSETRHWPTTKKR